MARDSLGTSRRSRSDVSHTRSRANPTSLPRRGDRLPQRGHRRHETRREVAAESDTWGHGRAVPAQRHTTYPYAAGPASARGSPCAAEGEQVVAGEVVWERVPTDDSLAKEGQHA